MHVFDMKGAWGPVSSTLYDALIGGSTAAMFEATATTLLADVAPLRIADVGAGPGHHAVALARRFPDAEVVGVDLSERMVALARRRAAGTPNVRFEIGDAMALPLSDAAFDLVFSLGSIKHWPDPARGLSELARICAPGGRILVLEADRGALLSTCRHLAGRFKLIPSPVGALYFHTVVAGQSLDIADAREAGRRAGIDGLGVERLPGWPYWVLRGTRA